MPHSNQALHLALFAPTRAEPGSKGGSTTKLPARCNSNEQLTAHQLDCLAAYAIAKRSPFHRAAMAKNAPNSPNRSSPSARSVVWRAAPSHSLDR